MTESMHNHQLPLWEQGEQQHWPGLVRSYISEHPRARAIEIAAATGCTEAYALALLSDTVWEFSGETLLDVLEEVKAWDRVMVLVRNGEAIAEVEVSSDSWYIKGDWLNWIEPDYNLHIRAAATTTILALIRAGAHGPSYSFNLVNQAGEVFCRFYARTPAARERLPAFCAPYPRWPA